MKKYFITTIILLSCFITGFRLTQNQIYIKGHLKNNKDITDSLLGLQIIAKCNDKILAQTYTGVKGDFELHFTSVNQQNVNFFCNGIGIDSLLIGSIKTFDNNTPDITLYLPADVKKDILGRVKCLICGKADQVYPIAYGDALPIVRHISKKGDTTYSSIYKGRYNVGSCIVGMAKHFCNRDKVKF